LKIFNVNKKRSYLSEITLVSIGSLDLEAFSHCILVSRLQPQRDTHSLCVYSIYTVFQKKLVHQTHMDNLVNSQRIFKFFHWHTLQKICYKTVIKKFHQTLYASLHYLVKHECYKLAFCVR